MNNPRKTKSPAAVVMLILLVITIIAAIVWLSRSPSQTADNETATFPAAEGPLDITVKENGTIHPAEQVILKSELEGRNRILYLIPEGTTVQKGDLLVELDATSLQDRRIDMQIKVQNAESAFIQSRENIEVVKNKAASDVEEAEFNLRFAQEDLTQYRDGEYPNKVKELQAKVTLAQEDLQRAREKLAWSEKLFAEKYLAESEVKADSLAVRKAELDVELAENNLNLLNDFEYKREINKRENDVRQAEMALERAQRKARADTIQAEAELRAKQAEFEQNQNQLQKIDEQIAKAKITAPREGFVIYATSAQFSWRGNVEPLAEGQEINERQELIYLPTAAGYVARIKIHESSIKTVNLEAPVTITVNALPDLVFTGKVSSIAPLPDPVSAFMNPDLKLYDTEISIDGGLDVLKTGMSCNTSILVESIDNAIYIPVHAVTRDQGTTVAYVQTPEGIEKRQVTIGQDDGRMIQIRDGITPGENILLAPPLDAAQSNKRQG